MPWWVIKTTSALALSVNETTSALAFSHTWLRESSHRCWIPTQIAAAVVMPLTSARPSAPAPFLHPHALLSRRRDGQPVRCSCCCVPDDCSSKKTDTCQQPTTTSAAPLDAVDVTAANRDAANRDAANRDAANRDAAANHNASNAAAGDVRLHRLEWQLKYERHPKSQGLSEMRRCLAEQARFLQAVESAQLRGTRGNKWRATRQ